MNSEQEVLKILENKGKAHIQFIAKQMRIGNDYTRFICRGLVKKGLIKSLKKRDWYEITPIGKEKSRGGGVLKRSGIKKEVLKIAKALRRQTLRKKRSSKKPKKKIKEEPKKEVKDRALSKAIKKAIEGKFNKLIKLFKLEKLKKVLWKKEGIFMASQKKSKIKVLGILE